MRKLFSTAEVTPGARFRRWRELIVERVVPVELRPLGEQPFKGTLESADLEALPITRVTQTAMETTSTAETVRRHRRHDSLTVMMVLNGTVSTLQRDRAAVQQAGDIVVLERQPSRLRAECPSQVLLIEAPRGPIEASLGRVDRFSSLTIGGVQPTTHLAFGFFQDVCRTREEMSVATSARLAAVGLDLLIASMAERLDRDEPSLVRPNLILERAKAFIRSNAANPMLSPQQVAAAAGVSLRGLQVIFGRDGKHVSICIWQHRLQLAAGCLRSPSQRLEPIGNIAYRCGFRTQTHFSRRFKDHFGLTPSDYRERSLMTAAMPR